MTSRERVLTALDHREPDRIPIDFGGSEVTSLTIAAYDALRRRLNLPSIPITTMEIVQQIAWVDEDVMDIVGSDVVPVFADPPATYSPSLKDEGPLGVSFEDEFGATLRMPLGGCYFDWREFPLAAPDLDALQKMPWPDPLDAARYEKLRERTLLVRSRTERALFGMASCGHDLLNQLFRVRGMDEGLMDLLSNQDFAEAFLERFTRTIVAAQKRFLGEVGDLIDIHFAADDLAGQFGPLISPDAYRRLVKPRQARIFETIRSCTKAKLFYHSCGAIADLLPDLIEIGVEIINPIQVAAAGMDTAALKRRFGKHLSFWGGGCDSQRVLPQGTLSEVRAEVRRRISDLAPGGGYVFSSIHNIQADVDPEKILAIFEEARRFGAYPLFRS